MWKFVTTTGANTMNTPKIENMTSNKGNKVPNQLTITTKDNYGTCIITQEVFQSYNATVARKVEIENKTGAIIDNFTELDERYWEYSATTGKYRNQFLNETKAETEKKIKVGEYQLTNLNK